MRELRRQQALGQVLAEAHREHLPERLLPA